MARTRIAKFNIQITASAEQVRQVFSKLGDQTKTMVGKLTNNITSLSFAWNQVSQALGPIVTQLREIREEVNEIGRSSTRLKVSPVFLQTLKQAGSDAGVTFDTIRDGLRDMQERIGQLRLGEKAAGDAFAAIGLGDGNLSKDLAVAFEQVRQGLSSIDDQTRRSAIGTQIFGESFREMIELFERNDLITDAAERLDELGTTLTEKQIKAVQDFDKAWADLGTQWKANVNTLTFGLIPGLTNLLKTIGDITAEVRAWSDYFANLLPKARVSFGPMTLSRLREIMASEGGQEWTAALRRLRGAGPGMPGAAVAEVARVQGAAAGTGLFSTKDALRVMEAQLAEFRKFNQREAVEVVPAGVQ